MNVGFLLELAAEGMPDRVAVGSRDGDVTYRRLLEQAHRAARVVRATTVGGVPAERLAMLDLNSATLPVLLFGAAFGGVPFVPLNYRLADDRLRDLVARNPAALLVVDPPVVERVGAVDGVRVATRAAFHDLLESQPGGVEALPEGDGDDEAIAVLLFTSGTTGPPKAAVLRHRHLTSYILDSGNFGAAGEDEATLVSVPPYHVAGVSAVLSAVYAGRRLVYLPAFAPGEWVATARDEQVTHAMVVPTMLGRILDELEATGTALPALGHLSYGGGPMPVAVIERAMRLLPHVNFVNAYGLTETSSTVAVLTPDDHREAVASDDPVVRARLGSVGRPLPAIELEIRDPFGEPVPAGEPGEVWVRGEQVAGEYARRRERRRGPGPRGGLVPHPRRRLHRRRRLPVPVRAAGRRDRPRRREHLARRDRGGAAGARRGRRGRRRRRAGRPVGRAGGGLRRRARRGAGDRGRSCRPTSGPGCARRARPSRCTSSPSCPTARPASCSDACCGRRATSTPRCEVSAVDEFSTLAEAAAEVARPAPAVARVLVDAGAGLRVGVVRWGQGDPEVVFLHGGGQNARTWDLVALALGRPALAVDLPGHGRSDWRADRDYRPARNAEAVTAVLRELAPRPVVLVGMSLGGLTGIRVARVGAEHVRALVVVDVTPPSPPGRAR